MLERRTSIRATDLEITLKNLEKHKEEVGITRVADISYLDISFLPVFMAIRPEAKSLSTSQGKGFCRLSAQCSAIMESIETFYAENVQPDFLNIKPSNLDGKYVHPNTLSPAINYIDENRVCDWVKGRALVDEQDLYLPYLEYSLDTTKDDVLHYSPDTTGLASGNSYQEAVLHGLFECIERSKSLKSSHLINIPVEYQEILGRDLECSITAYENEYDIPCFEANIKSRNPFENQVVYNGSGAHMDKYIALNRSITEAIQSRVTTISGAREDIGNEKYEYGSTSLRLLSDKKDFDAIKTYRNIPLDQMLKQLTSTLQKKKKEAVVYCYHISDICVVKVRIIDSGDVFNE